MRQSLLNYPRGMNIQRTPANCQRRHEPGLTKHMLSMDLIEGVLHIDDGKTTVIELPGTKKSGRERTRAAYLMAGLESLFGSCDPSFGDEHARELCEHFGCYDHGNHSTDIKSWADVVALGRWVEYSSLSMYKSNILTPLHKARAVEYDAKNGRAQITPPWN
jgi:hypothetical protein